MITQDSLRFYRSHSVYEDFGGIVLDSAEGERIAQCLGNGKAIILQNHGLLTVGGSVDEAAFWFLSLERTCQAQLLVEAAMAGNPGLKKKVIGEEEARFTYKQVGSKLFFWFCFCCLRDEKGGRWAMLIW
jgi:ribulose-5-phosphate 4-epimerase/fuculose-1-phosphate aldolase